MNRRTFCSLPLAAALPLTAQNDAATVDPGAPKAAIERWKDLRFGMFIHWGPVSIVGTEISWSRGAERRGRPGVGGYKITSQQSPYRKDIVRMLSDACHRAGLDWGVYYSQPDWHHPDYRNGAAHGKYIEYLHGQVRELLTNYGPTREWFFDGLGGAAADWDAPRLLRMMRRIEPDLIINDRAGLPADLDTPEQRIGMFQNNRPWETCATVGTQWAYKPGDELRSMEECLRGLVCCAIGDGNLLFNVGPRPDGLIEESHAARLREIGAFLRRYGESIYATRGGPFVAPDENKRPANTEGFVLAEGNWWGGSTHRGNTIYLHILRWPSDAISLPPMPRRILRHSLLGGGNATVKQTESGVRVSVPAARRHAVDTIVKLELDGPAGTLPVLRES